MYSGLHAKCLVFLPYCYRIWISKQIAEKPTILNENLSSGSHADASRQADKYHFKESAKMCQSQLRVIIIIISLVTGLFFLVILLNQQ